MKYPPSEQYAPRESSLCQLEAFTGAIFEPHDLIEIRAIRTPVSSSAPSNVVWRTWKTRGELLDLHQRMYRHNAERANLYFGVNPRSKRSGTKASVKWVRSIWADIDNETPRQVIARLDARVPRPSICISSGHGVHLYWLLETPVDVSSRQSRCDLESLLRNLHHEIRSDATQDVSRLLRLPGFNNVKNRPAVPCEIVFCDRSRQYSLERFRQWHPASNECKTAPVSDVMQEPSDGKDLAFSDFSLRDFSLHCDCDVVASIRRLVQRLDRPTTDRSRRDFAIVCELLRLGVSPEAVRQLVDGHSKFTSSGYIESTVANARLAVFG